MLNQRVSPALAAIGGAGLLSLMAVFNAASAIGDDTALIMGYSFAPDPDAGFSGTPYLDKVSDFFLNPSGGPYFPGQPLYPSYTPTFQYTPEGGYHENLIPSVNDLDQGIQEHLAEGGRVVVFGYSQSASVATQEMINLGALPADQRPDSNALSFILVESMNNPSGGLFERGLPGVEMAPTPTDTPYDTSIYSIEYSAMSDFPKYPLNLLADANAISGYVFLHTFLAPIWPTTFDPSSLSDAIQLPVSEASNTDYYLIPTQDLPLLAPLRAIPFFGPAMADLIQPDLRVLIDLGYDRTDLADVVQPAVWSFPSVDMSTVMSDLELGAQQGWTAFQVDLGILDPSNLPDLYPYLPDIDGLVNGQVLDGLATAIDPGAFV